MVLLLFDWSIDRFIHSFFCGLAFFFFYQKSLWFYLSYWVRHQSRCQEALKYHNYHRMEHNTRSQSVLSCRATVSSLFVVGFTNKNSRRCCLSWLIEIHWSIPIDWFRSAIVFPYSIFYILILVIISGRSVGNNDNSRIINYMHKQWAFSLGVWCHSSQTSTPLARTNVNTNHKKQK